MLLRIIDCRFLAPKQLIDPSRDPPNMTNHRKVHREHDKESDEHGGFSDAIEISYNPHRRTNRC